MRRVVLPAALLIAFSAVTAQEVPVGRVAQTSVGQVGQRQAREQAAPNVRPLGRGSSRIQTRVQSRIRSRIDRYYDPQVNAISPFEVASERARTAGRPAR